MLLLLLHTRSRITYKKNYEKLTGSQLAKQFPAFYGTRRFIIAFTSAHHLPNPEPDQSSPFPHYMPVGYK